MSRPMRTSHRRYSPMALVWSALATAVGLAWSIGLVDRVTLQIVLGLIGIAFGAVGFLQHGGSRVSAPAIAMFGAMLFIFLPAVLLPSNRSLGLSELDLVPAATFALVAHLALYYLLWLPRCKEDPPLRVIPHVDPGPGPRRLAVMGFAFCGIALAATLTPLRDVVLLDGVMYAGLALLAVGGFRSTRASIIMYVAVAIGFLAYAEFIFEGFGRIKLGSLALVLAIAIAHRWKGRRLKAVVLLAFIPGLAYLARSRVAFTAQINANQSSSVDGLESVIGPMARFAQLMSMDDRGLITYGGLDSFFASAVAFVPRAIWPEKPVGFGVELVEIFRPELLGTGHSEAALVFGEFVYASGWMGLLLGTVLYGVFVALLDRPLRGSSQPHALRTVDLATVAFVAVLAASVVDLLWGGTFTYVTRVVPRLAVIALVIGVSIALRPRFRVTRTTAKDRSVATR